MNSSDMILSKGYAAYDSKSGLKPFDFKRRPVGTKDILVKILYCGICHSDIHTVRSEWGDREFPIVPGHEIIGKVERVGGDVTRFKAGDIVGIGCMVDSCRKCESCKAGAEYACEMGGPIWTYGSEEKHIGGKTYGGYSSNIVVDEAFTLKIPSGLDLAATAPLLCAGTTTYTPLKYWKVGPGQKIGIIGLGGLGHIAVKLAHSFGADVTVLTTSRDKLNDALKFGASSTLLITDKKAMKDHAGKFDLILDTASSKHEINSFLNLLKRDGKLVLVGLPSEPLSINAFSIVSGHHVLAGSGLGGIKETQEMLDYCAKKKIGSEVEVIPIQKVNEAYERVVKGDVRYRFVIDINSLNKER